MMHDGAPPRSMEPMARVLPFVLWPDYSNNVSITQCSTQRLRQDVIPSQAITTSSIPGRVYEAARQKL